MNEVFFKKCKSRLERISNSMILTNQCFYVIMQLRDYQKKHNELINISPAFFNSVYDSCMEYLFIETDKMFDSNKDSDGVFGLLNKIDGSIDFLDNSQKIEANETSSLNSNTMEVKKYDSISLLVKKFIDRIDKKQDVITNVRILRDKYFAHFDANADPKTLFQNYSVSLYDIESLLVLNTNAVNALNAYFNKKTIYPVATNYKDFSKTIAYIQKGVAAENREIENMI